MNNEQTRKFRGTWAPTLVDSDVKRYEQYQGVSRPVPPKHQTRNVTPSIRAKQIALFDENGAPRSKPLDPERVDVVSNNDQAGQNPNVPVPVPAPVPAPAPAPVQQVNHYEWNNSQQQQQQQQQQVIDQSRYYNTTTFTQQQQQYNPVSMEFYGQNVYQGQQGMMPQMVQPMYYAPPPPPPPPPSVVGYVHTDLGDDSAVPVLFPYPFM